MSEIAVLQGDVGTYEVDLDETNVTDIKKINFLRAFEGNVCNISKTCKKIGINRITYYRWINKDKKFKAVVESVREGLIDWLESELYREIHEGGNNKVTAIMFALKCLGKHRGWQEYTKIDHTIKHEIPPIRIILGNNKEITNELQNKK